MGLMKGLFDLLFGGKPNVLTETLRTFGAAADATAARESSDRASALAQFSAEFVRTKRSRFDRFIDGVNRLPRPALALGTLALFGAAMTNPVWFAERMAGVALVPEPLWWLMGAVVSFYFGARHQAKGQEFQRSLALVAAAAPVLSHARASAEEAGNDDGADPATPRTATNPALAEWQAGL